MLSVGVRGRNFIGIELDVLVGHPEHDLLFVAFQVATAAGLKNAKASVSNIRTNHNLGRQIGALVHDGCISLPIDHLGKRLKENEQIEWATVGALSQSDRGLINKPEYSSALTEAYCIAVLPYPRCHFGRIWHCRHVDT
ncbi:hypothetical protein [Pseudomonas fluorescens]|uniref:hypothetical protein n=1 Tax=Pseudomonas fluorescens TaxID=294 RepID=UPI00123F4EE8|nr:hypothetical protein [Pseudomonas fluorescens]